MCQQVIIMNEDYNYPTPNESGSIDLIVFSWPNIMFCDHFRLAAISFLLLAIYV